MKKTQEIIGLPIISISDGVEMGKVKSIIINAVKGAIDYIVVDSGIQIASARVIPTGNILGIGEYALTIENDAAISDISKIPSAIDLLQKNIQVRGAKVLTKKGRLIGEIGDIFIDEDDGCKITGLEFIADITQERVRIIPRDSVITFGKSLVVVNDDVENSLLERSTQLSSGEKNSDDEKKNSVISDEDTAAHSTSLLSEEVSDQDNGSAQSTNPENSPAGVVFETEASLEETTSFNENAPPSETSAADLFEQKQRQYLIGRRATKTVTDSSGNIIIHEGSVIDGEIIDQAKREGKLIGLVMNNRPQ